jgi:hypothetical protein
VAERLCTKCGKKIGFWTRLLGRGGELCPSCSFDEDLLAGETRARAKGREITEVRVMGLGSVSGVVMLKRSIGGIPGVRSVRIRLRRGLDDLVFGVEHDQGTALEDLIPRLPHFAARRILRDSAPGDAAARILAFVVQDPDEERSGLKSRSAESDHYSDDYARELRRFKRRRLIVPILAGIGVGALAALLAAVGTGAVR